MSVSPAQCPSTDVLESIALGGETPAAFRQHLASCSTCRDRLARIRADNEFLTGFAVEGSLPAVRTAEPSHEISIPGYQVVREIRRGGQGVVYQAVQRSTKRDVAIKVMKQGPFATLADRSRFTREIETLGGLDHPNIVAIHDAGVISGFHYFVMDYVDGEALDEYVAARRHLAPNVLHAAEPPSPVGSTDAPRPIVDDSARPARRRAGLELASVLGLFIKICDAVHAAHLRGVMHRDLKPSNIRVDRSGEPHVLDFGLAKSTDAERDSAMTRTGQFVGSLPWASPEQVEGDSARIDLRTDVYSLGAILFQILTGALPFDIGSNLRSVFENVVNRPPPRPSAVRSSTGGPPLDDELDTIVLKCLSKDPERRYQSAGDLARDLRRYLSGDAIEAKRESAMYVLRKTLQRYRFRVAAAVAFVALLGVFGVVMAVLYRHSTRLEKEAVRSASSLSDLLSSSSVEQGRMAGMLGNMDQAEQLLWRELLLQRLPGEEAAVRLTAPPGPPQAYWGLWEVYRRFPCLRTVTMQPGAPRTLTVASDGTSVWTANYEGFVQEVDQFGARTDSFQLSDYSPMGWIKIDRRGTTIVGRGRGGLVLWRRSARIERAFQPLPDSDGAFELIRLAHSGERVAAACGGEARVWDLGTGRPIAHVAIDQHEIRAIALSNDERRLAVRDRSGSLFLWDLESEQLLARVGSGVGAPEWLGWGDLLFSPDGRRLADAWWDMAGRIWDLTTDPPTATLLSEVPASYRVQGFSPDSRLLAIGDASGALRVFDAGSGQRLTSFAAHPSRILGVGFTGDGRAVWTCGASDLRLWEVAADAGVGVSRFADDKLHGVSVSPDGQWLVAGGSAGRLRRIERDDRQASAIEIYGNPTVASVAVSPDGRRVAAATYGNAALLWPAEDLWQRPIALLHPQGVSFVCFSADSLRVATACDDRIVRVWRAADGALERELHGCEDRIPQAAFDATGRRVAAAVRDGSLLVWDTQTGERQTWATATRSPLRAVRFAPDNQRLFTAGADRSVNLWDVSTRQRIGQLAGHGHEIYCLDISPDGALIASGDSGGAIRLWHARLLRPLATLDGHDGAVMAVRFTPDGRTLVSVSLDGTVREWRLDYYERHIAGQVDAQLRKLPPEIAASPQADAWRAWAMNALGAPVSSD
jgi:serine/threonine protein kinase/WD40 repeat protein